MHQEKLIGTIMIMGKKGLQEPENKELLAYANATANVIMRMRAEIELMESEKRFKSIFEAMPFPISVTRMSDQKHIEINDAYCQMVGRPRSDIIGKSAIELGADRETSDRHETQLLETGKIDSAILEIPKSDGVSKMDLVFFPSCRFGWRAGRYLRVY
jgi:PAS domain S-box-containing protein